MYHEQWPLSAPENWARSSLRLQDSGGVKGDRTLGIASSFSVPWQVWGRHRLLPCPSPPVRQAGAQAKWSLHLGVSSCGFPYKQRLRQGLGCWKFIWGWGYPLPKQSTTNQVP